MSLRPYLTGFRLALSQELIHRTNFFIGRIRDLIFYAALIFVFQNMPQGVGPWSQHTLLTYTLVSAFISAQLTAQTMHTISSEISEGDLTNFLLRPINYLGYCWARVSASRVLSALGGLGAVGILLLAFPNIQPSLPHIPLTWLVTGLLFLGSLTIMQLIDFIAGLLSFWTDRAYGPRFLTIILLQFCSGAFIPLNTLPSSIQHVLQLTPFPSLVFAPARTWIEGVTPSTVLALQTQLLWILILSGIVFMMWRRGLKSYAAYGR